MTHNVLKGAFNPSHSFTHLIVVVWSSHGLWDTTMSITMALAHRCCFGAASPRLRTSPASQSFVVNSTVVVRCLSDSHPTPSFSWRRGASVVTSSDRLRVDAEAGTLVIRSAAETDDGLWECVASNERGEATGVAQLNLIGQTTSYYCYEFDSMCVCVCVCVCMCVCHHHNKTKQVPYNRSPVCLFLVKHYQNRGKQTTFGK